MGHQARIRRERHASQEPERRRVLADLHAAGRSDARTLGHLRTLSARRLCDVMQHALNQLAQSKSPHKGPAAVVLGALETIHRERTTAEATAKSDIPRSTLPPNMTGELDRLPQPEASCL